MKEMVLKAMREAGKPVSAGDGTIRLRSWLQTGASFLLKDC